MLNFLLLPIQVIIAYIQTMWRGVIEYVTELITVTMPNFIWSKLPGGLTDELENIDLTPLLDIFDAATWIYPLWGITTIYFSAYTVCGGIRLVRYVIGWIPTVEG